MSAVMLALLLQSTSITGDLEFPRGTAAATTAQVALLPLEYANLFNAEAQQNLDEYWENFKPRFAARKEAFFEVMPLAYNRALDFVLSRMRRDSKVNSANLIKTTTNGHFEFRGVLPGEYKLVATASIKGTDHVWTETLQVEATPVFLRMKTRVP
jgi:hypothetical protein